MGLIGLKNVILTPFKDKPNPGPLGPDFYFPGFSHQLMPETKELISTARTSAALRSAESEGYIRLLSTKTRIK